MKIEVKKDIWEKIELEYYQGSLDFPCNFCDSNSYKNYHISINGNLRVVICEECLNKIKQKPKKIK